MDKMIISELEVGDLVKGELAVIKAEKKTASNGPYAMLTLTDGVQTIVAKRWKFDGDIPAVGSVLCIIADVGQYNGTLDLNIKRWAPGELPVSEFLRKGHIDADTMWDHLGVLINNLGEGYRELVMQYYLENKEEILSAPGAKSVHHDYYGGLAQHILEVALMTKEMCSVMSSLGTVRYDADLAIAGALLHDVGKIESYKFVGAAIDTTDAGKFLDHILIGAHRIMALGEDMKIDSLIIQKVVHIIASHHGRLEYGSPVLPMTPEAVIVHSADLASSKCTIMNDTQPASGSNWSTRNFYTGAQIYKGQ